MKSAAFVSLAMLASLACMARPALADDVDPGCASTIDFRIVGSWVAEDDGERMQFLPESRTLSPRGRPVTIEACMTTADDLQETALTEIAPHIHAMTETHYHLGFVGLDRVLVTFPGGVVHLFHRMAAAPQHALEAVLPHRRT
ncbi:MAG: hypothetical protein NVS2B8_16400 [Vulcanimicrobiaceae bacterium]